MDKNQDIDTSNASNDDPKNRPFSPTKYITDIGRLRSERLIKTAEVETRTVCYKAFKAVHDEIVRQDPTINQVNFQHFEDYQLAETSKRLDEIKTIDEKMQEVRDSARKSRSQQ